MSSKNLIVSPFSVTAFFQNYMMIPVVSPHRSILSDITGWILRGS